MRGLERGHLRLGIRLEKRLVVLRVGRRVCVCVGAVARPGGGFGRRAVGRGVGFGKCAFPAGAAADVVEVFGAVGVGLGPFAADGWAPAFLISTLSEKGEKRKHTQLSWC